MKKLFLLLLCSIFALTSCTEDELHLIQNTAQTSFKVNKRISANEFELREPAMSDVGEMYFQGFNCINPGKIQVKDLWGNNQNYEKENVFTYTYRNPENEVFTVTKTGSNSFNVKFSEKAHTFNRSCTYFLGFREKGRENFIYSYSFEYDYNEEKWIMGGGIYGIEE